MVVEQHIIVHFHHVLGVLIHPIFIVLVVGACMSVLIVQMEDSLSYAEELRLNHTYFYT